MQRVSFREGRHRRLRLSSVSLRLIQGTKPREKPSTDSSGMAEVISLMVAIRRKSMKVVTKPTASVPALAEMHPTTIKIPTKIDVDAFEETFQLPPKKRSKKVEPLQLREALKAGRDFILSEEVLADYVRSVLKFDWGFRKFVSQRINRMLQQKPYLSRTCSHVVLRGMVVADLRREINDELRNDAETARLNEEMQSGATAFRTCHYGSGGRQLYFVMAHATKHEIISLRLPGAFNRFKEYRGARKRSYNNHHGRRYREKSYLRLVR